MSYTTWTRQQLNILRKTDETAMEQGVNMMKENGSGDDQEEMAMRLPDQKVSALLTRRSSWKALKTVVRPTQ